MLGSKIPEIPDVYKSTGYVLWFPDESVRTTLALEYHVPRISFFTFERNDVINVPNEKSKRLVLKVNLIKTWKSRNASLSI